MVSSVLIWPTQRSLSNPHKWKSVQTVLVRPCYFFFSQLRPAHLHSIPFHPVPRRPVCQLVLHEGQNLACLPERSSAEHFTVTLSRTSRATDSPLMNESEGSRCKSVCRLVCSAYAADMNICFICLKLKVLSVISLVYCC